MNEQHQDLDVNHLSGEEPEYLDSLPGDELVSDAEQTAAERWEVVPHRGLVSQSVHQLLLPPVPHQRQLDEPADDHGLVHPERGHQELRGLRQVNHQGQDERCDREQRSHPTCIWYLKNFNSESLMLNLICRIYLVPNKAPNLRLRNVLQELCQEDEEHDGVGDEDEHYAGEESGGASRAQSEFQLTWCGEGSFRGTH